MIQSLGWESLQHRHYINRLTMLFKIQHRIFDISPDFVQLNDQQTRGSKCLRQLPATNDAYKFSFYPRTISNWNQLPTHQQPPEPSGIQGCPCKPPSHTPHVQLDPQLHINSFKWGTWVFLSAFIFFCFYRASQFYTGYNTVWRRFLPFIWKKNLAQGAQLCVM